MNSIAPIIKTLEESHAFFNESLFGGKLKNSPVITLNPKGAKKTALGWYAHNRWQNKKSTLAELNLSAEELKRPAVDVLETLIHEMCHQYAHESEIKDCSRGGAYHNKQFRDNARSAGLIVDDKPDKRHGYAFTKLGPTALREVESILSKVEPVLALSRLLIVKAPTVGKMLLYMCGCGFKIRAGRRDLSARCNECESDFLLQN